MTEPNLPAKRQGGKRIHAGRRRAKVPRKHYTIWASNEEIEYIKAYLFRNRVNDPE